MNWPNRRCDTDTHRRIINSLQRREREILQQLEAQEESTAEIQHTYKSRVEEIELKTKKLKKVPSYTSVPLVSITAPTDLRQTATVQSGDA